MAAIGTGWADGAWVFEGWVLEAWDDDPNTPDPIEDATNMKTFLLTATSMMDH